MAPTYRYIYLIDYAPEIQAINLNKEILRGLLFFSQLSPTYSFTLYLAGYEIIVWIIQGTSGQQKPVANFYLLWSVMVVLAQIEINLYFTQNCESEDLPKILCVSCVNTLMVNNMCSCAIQWSLYREANRSAEWFWPHKGVRPHERGNFSNADGR